MLVTYRCMLQLCNRIVLSTADRDKVCFYLGQPRQLGSLEETLKELNLEFYENEFLDSGWDSYEWIMAQMQSNEPLNDYTLLKDLHITKVGHR